MGRSQQLVTSLPPYSQLARLSVDELERVVEGIRRELLPRERVHYRIDLSKAPSLREGEKLLRYTLSLCPHCLTLLRAVVFERDGKVWIRKVCPEHGEIEEVYWGDADLYKRFKKWSFNGRGNRDTQVGLEALCPYNCGLCPRHKSHPALVNLVATNRCDLSCWYCFFYAEKAGYVYEPSLNHIRYMLRSARRLSPFKPIALQITGGEPLLRDDIVDIVKIAKEEGFTHVQVNTTGLKLAFNPDLAVALRKAGTNVIYMSFDGVSPRTNPKNHWEVPYILESLRKAKLGVVLVPTVIRSGNLGELGDIIRFGLKHVDIVRGVNFQPVSLTGRISRAERERLRVTIPDAIIEIEKQTDGQVSRYDWYPVPSVVPISHFVEALTGEPKIEFTEHFACGAATYLFQDDGEIIPITRFVDVEGLFTFLEQKAEELKLGRNKYVVLLEVLWKLRKFVDLEKAPRRMREGRKLLKYIYKILVKHDYSSLGEFHYQTLFVGMMHFMDLYNYDVARVQRCGIHYAVPDGRLIPFCTFNVIPQLYRDRLQRLFSYTIEEWESTFNRKLAEDRYVRPLRKLLRGETYRRAYEGIFDVNSMSYEEHAYASKSFGIPVAE